MVQRQLPFQFNIDLGELEEMVQGVGGAAEGFAGEHTTTVLSDDALDMMRDRFAESADAFSLEDDSGIAHVYEYGMEGTPTGRLWHTTRSGAGKRQTLSFVLSGKSQVPVPLPPEAEGEDFDRAVHIWTDKATEQEYESVFHIQAGTDAKTRVSPGVSEWLLIYDKRGNPMYRKTWINYNPYQGNFREFFEGWWSIQPQRILENHAEEYLRDDVVRAITREVQSRVDTGRYSTSRVTPSRRTVNVTVKGTNRRMSSQPSKSVVRSITKKMRGMFK